jgi:hypothetical protein
MSPVAPVLLIESNVNTTSIRIPIPPQLVAAAWSKQVIRASLPVAIVSAVDVVATVFANELELEIEPRAELARLPPLVA